jgi:hypothetical protein
MLKNNDNSLETITHTELCNVLLLTLYDLGTVIYGTTFVLCEGNETQGAKIKIIERLISEI